jgi:hypothetical protein
MPVHFMTLLRWIGIMALDAMVGALEKGSPLGEKPKANFKVFLATQDIPVNDEVRKLTAAEMLRRELSDAEKAYWELTELANYQTEFGYFFYADTEAEAQAIADRAKEIYNRAGWALDAVFVVAI